MGRKILFITTDQQRYDALGCNGGTIARTRTGLTYRRAWDSQTPSHGMHFRSIYHRDGWLLTRYEPSTNGQPTGLERQFGDGVLTPCGIHYDGSEGELHDLKEDPLQWRNLWDEPRYRSSRSDLIADLYDHLPEQRSPRLLVDAPA